MKTIRNFSLLLILCTFFSISPAQARPAPESFADIVDDLLPMVVNISTSQTVESSSQFPGGIPQDMFPPGHPFEEFNEFFGQFDGGKNGGARKEKLTSLGSGFVISEDGLVVTNYHVIANAEEITVTFHDESQHEAEIIGHDVKTDLAVMKIVQKGKKKKFPAVKFGDSDKARVGDWVIAIGNPFNLGGTVTAGIISARARDINAGPFDDFIQTDAAINRGNSGGPLFTLDGKVVGINSAIYSPSGGNVGIGFAIPVAMAEPIIKQLSQGKEIKRGWLGVKIQTVTKEIAESLGIEKEKGALVVEVVEDSPAEDAKFEKGDIILLFDGKEIAAMKKLPRIVAETEVGKKVKVEILRKGKKKTLTVVLGKLKEEEKELPASMKKNDSEEDEEAEEVIGLMLLELDDVLRKKHKLDDDLQGVIVVKTDPESKASEKGIRRGDIISEANQTGIKDIKDFKNAIREAKKQKKKSILLYIVREGDGSFVAVPLK